MTVIDSWPQSATQARPTFARFSDHLGSHQTPFHLTTRARYRGNPTPTRNSASSRPKSMTFPTWNRSVVAKSRAINASCGPHITNWQFASWVATIIHTNYRKMTFNVHDGSIHNCKRLLTESSIHHKMTGIVFVRSTTPPTGTMPHNH